MRLSTRITLTLTAILAVLAYTSVASAQQPTTTTEKSNLQVIPKDTPRDVILTRMRTINAALGVQCDYCHVVNPDDPSKNDFVIDVKQAKIVARGMMRMVGPVNQLVAKAVEPKAADQVAQLGCAGCHRGAPIPKVEAGSPGAPPPPAPAAK